MFLLIIKFTMSQHIDPANIWQGSSPNIYYFTAPPRYAAFDGKMRSFRVPPGKVLTGVSISQMTAITGDSDEPQHNVWKTYFPVRGMMEFNVPVGYKGKDGLFLPEGDLVTFFEGDEIKITPAVKNESRFAQLPLMVMWFAKPCPKMVSYPKIRKGTSEKNEMSA
jgi:hypothetical protein